MEKISQEQISDFVKLLVEYGGLYTVNKDHVIVGIDNNPVALKTKNNTKILKIFHDNMSIDPKFAVLNPLIESLSSSHERLWLWTVHETCLQFIVKKMFKEVVSNLQTSDEEVSEKNLAISNLSLGLRELVDDKTLDKIESISNKCYLNIYYDRPSRTAQLQSKLFTEPDTVKGAVKGLRNKDISALVKFMQSLFQTEQLSEYKAVGTHVGMYEAQARIMLLIKITEIIAPAVKAIINVDLHADELIARGELLDKYHKLVRWFVTTNKNGSIANKLPWEVENNDAPAAAASPVPAVATPTPSFAPPAPAQPAAVPLIPAADVARASLTPQFGNNPLYTIQQPNMLQMHPFMGQPIQTGSPSMFGAQPVVAQGGWGQQSMFSGGGGVFSPTTTCKIY